MFILFIIKRESFGMAHYYRPCSLVVDADGDVNICKYPTGMFTEPFVYSQAERIFNGKS